MHDSGTLYVLRHLMLFTGLSERTLRSYLASGLLQGEKINGLWHFTAEQVEAFIRHPAVKPGIQAAKTAVVLDFLADNHKASPQSCVILDLPDAHPGKASEFFCDEINRRQCENLFFALDWSGALLRLILRGPEKEVFSLVAAWHNLTT